MMTSDQLGGVSNYKRQDEITVACSWVIEEETEVELIFGMKTK